MPTLDRELNVQLESAPLIIKFGRTTRASREFQSDAQQREVYRVRSLRWWPNKMTEGPRKHS